ncbi:MAG: hypothetical protein U1A72_20545, partial [Sulfuritalea sp.]|nr:hypothetical protein [Sulfuritalea sp.]
LSISNKVTNLRNAYDTFKPYAPGQIIGDTTPTLPEPPPPPAQSSDDGGCGGLGSIIVMAVAIVATVMTAGAMLPQCFSSLGAMMSAGAAALTTNVGIALVAGAIGSIASQAVGMALGVQESFSWKNVALSAIGAGVTAGLGAGGITGGVSDALGSAVAGAVLKGTVSQGIAVAVGLQEKFDWKGVAASAVGAALSYGADWGLPKTDTGNAWGGLLRSAAIGMAGGAAQQLVYGGKANWGTVAADAFGNVLGSSVVGGMTAVGNAQQGAALDDAEQLAGDQGNERLYRQGIVPGGGDVGDEIPGMGGYAAGKRRVAGIEIAAKRGDPRNQSARLIYAEDFEVVAPNGRLLHPQHVEGIISDASPDLPQVGDQLVFKEEEHALLGSVVFRDVYGYGNEKWVPRFVLGKDYIKNENDFISGAISLDYPKSTDPHDGRSNRVGTWWAVEVGKANREDIAVQSHKGYLQIWHAMTPDPSLTNMEVRDRILGQMETWWNAGLDSGSLVPIGKLVGHTVFDSFSRSHVARYPNGDIAFFQDYNLQDGHKHGSADGPIFIAVPVAGNNDGWLATQEAIRARKVGRELLQMFKDGRSFGEARAVLIEKVYRFAPGTGDDLSGGTLKEYAKDPKNARPLRNK